MKKVLLVLLLLFFLSFGTACVSKSHNPDITIQSPDIDEITPYNVGSFDVYTAEFQMKNPTNMTFKNVEVQINLFPAMAYCHSLTKTIEIPVFYPLEKRTDRVSVVEFSNLDCQYYYTYDVISEK